MTTFPVIDFNNDGVVNNRLTIGYRNGLKSTTLLYQWVTPFIKNILDGFQGQYSEFGRFYTRPFLCVMNIANPEIDVQNSIKYRCFCKTNLCNKVKKFFKWIELTNEM